MTESTTAESAAAALRVQQINKRFGDVNVLQDISFELRHGEVHALLGENGAGKSTLMNILTGIYAADTGSIEVMGRAAQILSPADALQLGIGMVHQHFRLVMPFTARENIRLAAGAFAALRNPADCDRAIAEVMQSSGLDAPLDSPVHELSVADQQRIEILKALVLGARILILDEPTAVLTDAESESLLALENASVLHKHKPLVDQVSLQLRAAEIVGIAGVGGNGQQELAAAIVGLSALSAGRILLDGKDFTAANIESRRDAGLRFVPSDRATLALVPGASVNENLAATAIRTGALGAAVSRRGIGRFASALIKAFDIAGVTGNGHRPIRLLSGGNAQKAVLARELDDNARIIIAHSPTRGLDVAACRYVHDCLIDAAANGAAILLISEDLEEILSLSDRVLVMNRGVLVATGSTTLGTTPDRHEIGSLMLGHA